MVASVCLERIQQAIPYAGTWGWLGVLIFFAISGYLNAQSLFRSQSVPTFLASRALRIFPALFMCVAFCILLGACVSSENWQGYLAPGGHWLARNGPLSFFWRNTTLLFGQDFELPGVFVSNVYPRAVNGSLWTLPHEVKLYLVLAGFGIACRFKPWLFSALIVAALCGVMLFGLTRPLEPILTGKYLMIFAIIFAAGAALATIEHRLDLVVAVAIVSILLLGFAVSGNPTVAVLFFVAMTCVLINRIALPSWLSPKVDISYGVYLYAFPIQQLTSTWSDSFWVRLLAAVVIVTALGIASAAWIEEPALRWRKTLGRHRAVAQPHAVSD